MILVLCFNVSTAQNDILPYKDYEFIKYLIGNDMKEEALTWAKRDFDENKYEKSVVDSVFFLKGWVFYSSKQLSKARECFDKVSNQSNMKTGAVFFSSLSSAYLEEYDLGVSNLEKNKTLLNNNTELYALEQAGLSLLKRDLKLYENYSKNFSYTTYNLADKEKILDSIFLSLKNYKKKSPFIAASLSAIVPGLGKVYAGQIGEGVSAFLTVGSFAAITTENWIKHGFLNWKTLLFGSLGTVFYVGNIWGSAVSVKIGYDDFNEKQNISILYNIHLPLRNSFGL